MLLTDPFLQWPTPNSVRVVWFTEFEGQNHTLTYGSDLDQIAPAASLKLSRVVEAVEAEQPVIRDIWRHEAIATGLQPGQRVPYFVSSQTATGGTIASDRFTLQPLPAPGQPLKILLTSDHQNMPNTHINLQKVEETVGKVDAVFFAGDLVNIPDNAAEWFERTERGIGFFPALQGRAQVIDPSVEARGGQILQHAHLFPAVGNHEVMGRLQANGFADYPSKQPRWYANLHYQRLSNGTLDRQSWIEDHSWNTVTYEEIFSLPDTSPGREQYYAIQYGDVGLMALFVTRPWRHFKLEPEASGKYHEADTVLQDPTQWLFGDFIFEPFNQGSTQYEWLVDQLNQPDFQQAKFKYVMLHQVSRGLGDNAVPLMVDPTMIVDYQQNNQLNTLKFPMPLDAADWDQIEAVLPTITTIRYDYPRTRDFWHLDVEPVLKAAGVDLVHHGHSHLWYRLAVDSLKFIETSNVGNSYGSYLEGYKSRHMSPPADLKYYDPESYPDVGDPYGAEPSFPSIASPMQHQDQPLPSVDSNDLTVFSILDTAQGTVSSYVVDSSQLDQPAQKFDEFEIVSQP